MNQLQIAKQVTKIGILLAESDETVAVLSRDGRRSSVKTAKSRANSAFCCFAFGNELLRFFSFFVAALGVAFGASFAVGTCAGRCAGSCTIFTGSFGGAAACFLAALALFFLLFATFFAFEHCAHGSFVGCSLGSLES